MPDDPHRRPLEGMLHPLVPLAVGLLAVNDHWLKAAWPGVVTGKLSDFAGLAFFPLMLQAMVEGILWAVGRYRGPDRRVLVGAAVATALVFGAVKVSRYAGLVYRHGLGALQWPAYAVLALLSGEELPGLSLVALVQDPTDLLALPAVLLAVWAGWSRGAPGSPSPGPPSPPP
jgi:hypothetical protein